MKPLKLQGIKLEDMSKDDWDEMDELARSTIMLTLLDIFLKCIVWRMYIHFHSVSNNQLLTFYGRTACGAHICALKFVS